MQRKTRSQIPESAFIPKPARIMAILQLCLAFTIICWLGSWPFMGEMLEHKRELFLFQTVMGGGDLVLRTYESQPETLDKLKRNHDRFVKMDALERESIVASYNKTLSDESESSFLVKVKGGLENILLQSSPWLRAWILFAVISSILLLKKSPGAPFAIWILPLLACMFWIESHQAPISISPDEALYPTENYLIATYGNGVLSLPIREQHAQLTSAWERYLAIEWSGSNDAEEGEWKFQLARLNAHLSNEKDRESPPSGLILCLFFIWNCCLAGICYRWKTPSAELVVTT